MNFKTKLGRGFALIFLAATGLLVQPVLAKGLGQILADLGIEPESLTLMQQNARLLYTSDAKSVGDAREWTNTTTGSKGVVGIVSIKENCVELQHRFKLAGSGNTVGTNVWRCQVANGDWQLADKP